MIFVAFKPLDSRKQATFPPMILEINDQILQKPVIALKKLVHEHFKCYLSPFINEQNIRLSIKQGQSMINDIPFYIYINLNQYTNYIQCQTQPNIQNEEQQRWKFIKNSLVYKIGHEDKIHSIPQKQIDRIDRIFEHILTKQKKLSVIINAYCVQISNGKKWSQLLMDHWKDFALENQCVYMKISIEQ